MSLLRVEGPDDLHTLMHLLIRHGFDYDTRRRSGASPLPEIQDSGGVESLLDAMTVAIRDPRYQRIGFVLDADAPVQSRWQAIRDRLVQVDITVPEQLPADGFIGESVSLRKRVGVWLMPDNQRDGNLEHFLQALIDSDDTLFLHARTSTNTSI